MEVAVEHGVQSVAFPSISTGAYGYPLEEAAPIALGTVMEALASGVGEGIQRVRFVLFGKRAYDVYAQALAHLTAAE
jgi:O-acetyl-ADP-ribose deacetylase (regulator of RNase III)